MGGVVLVHGLYHQAGHFGVVAAGLRRVGVEVVVPELHRGSLREDTRVVQEAVDGFGVAPVVVGHSYGGSVITGVRGAGHLVYLAAFVLDAGESAAEWGVGRVAGGRGGGRGGGCDQAAAGAGCRGVVRRLSRAARPACCGAVAGAGAGVRARGAGASGVADDAVDVRGVCAGPGDRPRGAAAHGRAVRGGAGVADGALPVRRAAGTGRGTRAGRCSPGLGGEGRNLAGASAGGGVAQVYEPGLWSRRVGG